MSHRVNKKTAKHDSKATHCHVCEKNGASIQECGTHNFRDTKGRVVCERFLQKMRSSTCYKCQRVGHFADRCVIVTKTTGDASVDMARIFKIIERSKRKVEPKKEKEAPVSKGSANVFAALDESSDDEKEDEKPPANVTVRKAVDKPKIKSWVDWDSDEE